VAETITSTEILTVFAESFTATAPVIIASAETMAFSESLAGSAADALEGVDVLGAFTESFDAITSYGLTSSEAMPRFSESLPATGTVNLVSHETMPRFHSGFVPSQTLSSAEQMGWFGDAFAAVTQINAAFSESMGGWGEATALQLIETPDGVWVVNIKTGAHSRYTGDLTGATAITGRVVTPVSQLGKDTAKQSPRAFVLKRARADIDLYVNTEEQLLCGPYTVDNHDKEGMHRCRARLALGLRGTDMQFTLEGTDFTLKSLEVEADVSPRVR
jgi:hypothetical protein